MSNTVQYCLKIALNLVLDSTDSKLLMIQEAKDHSRGLWFLPAGKGKAGETIIDTCVRETEEESGILTKPVYILKTEHILRKVVYEVGEDPKPLDVFRFIFIREALNNKLKTVETKDSIQAQWFELDKVKDLQLRSIEVLKYIDLYQSYKKSQSLAKVDDLLEVYHD